MSHEPLTPPHGSVVGDAAPPSRPTPPLHPRVLEACQLFDGEGHRGAVRARGPADAARPPGGRVSRPGYPEKSPSVVPKADATAKTLRHQGQCVASAKKTGRRCEAWTLTGGSFCFHHAAETLEEANGGPVVTAAEKRASILQGALHGMRRGPASIDLAQAIDLKIDTLEEIRAVRQVLFQELRARPWSHGDAQDQLQLLAALRSISTRCQRARARPTCRWRSRPGSSW
jgi:hypothetical protein